MVLSVLFLTSFEVTSRRTADYSVSSAPQLSFQAAAYYYDYASRLQLARDRLQTNRTTPMRLDTIDPYPTQKEKCGFAAEPRVAP